MDNYDEKVSENLIELKRNYDFYGIHQYLYYTVYVHIEYSGTGQGSV